MKNYNWNCYVLEDLQNDYTQEGSVPTIQKKKKNKKAMYLGCPLWDDKHDFFSVHGPHCDVVYDIHNHTNNLPF